MQKLFIRKPIIQNRRRSTSTAFCRHLKMEWSEDELEEAEESGEMNTWEAAFYRGFAEEDSDWAGEEL